MASFAMYRSTSPVGHLGDESSDAIIRNTLDIARSIFPEQTAEFQSWVDRKLTEYGISYAKYRAQQLAEAANQYTPLLWVAGGGLLLFALLRRK